MNTVARRVRGLAMGAALVAGAAATASAQVTFIGSTTFQFNGVGGFANTQTFHGLTFSTGTFTVTTNAPGDVQGFGGSNNAGTASLSVANPTFNFAGTTLDMLITFSSPSTSAQTFTAHVSGNIRNTANGVNVVWAPPQFNNIPFTIAPNTFGTFSIGLNNISATANGTSQAISGQIVEETITTTPEPASMVLLGTGLLGVVGVARRRNRKA